MDLAILRDTTLLKISIIKLQTSRYSMKIHFLCNKSPISKIWKLDMLNRGKILSLINSNKICNQLSTQAWIRLNSTRASKLATQTIRDKILTVVWSQKIKDQWNAILIGSLKKSITIFKGFTLAETIGEEKKYHRYSDLTTKDKVKPSWALKYKGKVMATCR